MSFSNVDTVNGKPPFLCRGPGQRHVSSLFRPWPLAILVAAVASSFLPGRCQAQSSVSWTTNYYTVTGATLPDIQSSIRQNRPWKDRMGFDGWTTWNIEWRLNVVTTTAGQWRVGLFSTRTTIVTTLPRWEAPDHAPEIVRALWDGYINALARHEAGHARIAMSAAAEQRRRVGELGEASSAEDLREKVNALARRIIEEHRKLDEQYDLRTRHGVKQGASLPSRAPRVRTDPDGT